MSMVPSVTGGRGSCYCCCCSICKEIEQVRQISELSSPLPKGMPAFVDFSTPQGISPYLHKQFQGQKELAAAHQVAMRVLGSSTYRQIGSDLQSNFGRQFPMNPELLAYAMQFVRDGKTVLELAGATGENAILLAFGGAGAAHLNDLSPTEKERFEKLKQELPENLREKLTFHTGDCLQIFKDNLELEGKVDLLLCRNLLHFFNDQQEAEFMALIRRLLKPGGKAICSACSIYGYYGPLDDVPAECKVATAPTGFIEASVIITDFDWGPEPKSTVYNGVRPLPQEEYSGNFSEAGSIFLAQSKGMPHWQDFLEEETQGKRIPECFKEAIMKTYESVIPKILSSSMKTWALRLVWRPRFRYYNIINLSSLFQKQGFKVEYTFAVGEDGHLISKGNLFETSTGNIGVIISLE